MSLHGCAEEKADPKYADSGAPLTAGDGGAPKDGAAASIGDAGKDTGGGGEVQVTVAEGKLLGKLSGKTRLFLGIPYAEPPLGELRFAPPQPAKPWAKPLETKEFGAPCPQPPGGLAAMGEQSEDCLSLNVYAPSDAKKLPVMVWIHGGAFIAGSANQYDGTRLANEGPVVVVSLNYRLGALGLLAHPALDAERGDVRSGNDAFRDQQLALTWVQNNIAAFGGDPDNVTVMGESAGSMSVCLHVVSPKSQTLAKRFVLESGSCVGGLPVVDAAKATAVGEKLATALCDGEDDVLACLRGKDPTEIVSWGNDMGISGAGWGPSFDAADDVLPELPVALIKKGEFSKGELIIGSNKNEWALFVALAAATSTPVTTVATLNATIDKQFAPAALATAIKGHYTATDATASSVWVKLMTDATFRCPARKLARLVSDAGSKVYLYSFEEGMALHAFEIPYVFGNENPRLGAMPLVEPVREAVQSYWRAFATSGDPNTEGMPEWPAYDTSADQHITLKAEVEVGSKLAEADCDFWDSLLP